MLKLGFDVAERTVSRYIPHRPANPDEVKQWMTFLRNHREAIAACDFLTPPTLNFEALYVFFVIGHARRDLVRVAVTANPTSAWVAQQLREAFPSDTAPRFLSLDRDSKFSADVHRALQRMGVHTVRTAYRSLGQNGVAERWVRSCRSRTSVESSSSESATCTDSCRSTRPTIETIERISGSTRTRRFHGTPRRSPPRTPRSWLSLGLVVSIIDTSGATPRDPYRGCAAGYGAPRRRGYVRMETADLVARALSKEPPTPCRHRPHPHRNR